MKTEHAQLGRIVAMFAADDGSPLYLIHLSRLKERHSLHAPTPWISPIGEGARLLLVAAEEHSELKLGHVVSLRIEVASELDETRYQKERDDEAIEQEARFGMLAVPRRPL